MKAQVGILSFLTFAAVAALSWPSAAEARAPEPGDKVRITLHDGNALLGELLGLGEAGYRIRFSGTEVIVAYPSVRGIEVVVEDNLLDEMRPRGRDFRTREPHFEPEQREPPPPPAPRWEEAPRPSAPPPAYRPPPPPEYRTPPPVYQPQPEPPATPPRSRSRRPPPPVQQHDDQSPGLSGTAPPKPPSRGGGFIAAGAVMAGVGVVASVASASAMNDNQSRPAWGYTDHGPLPGIFLAGTAMAITGAALGVTGIVMKSVSGAKRRRWEREYGKDDRLRWSIAPSVHPEGGGGLSVVGQF